MEIHLNITFPNLPCDLLTLDVMDVSGEQQGGVIHGVNKVRLGPASEGGRVLDITALDLYVRPGQTPLSPPFLTASNTKYTGIPRTIRPNISTQTIAASAMGQRHQKALRSPDAVILVMRFGRRTQYSAGPSVEEKTLSNACAKITRRS